MNAENRLFDVVDSPSHPAERSRATSHTTTLQAQLEAATNKFIGWLDQHGYDSYDPYDLWGTRYGLMARRLYYARHPLRIPLIAPIVAAEYVAPSVRKLLVRKQRFATADAQLLLAFLNLHAHSGNLGHLRRAEELAEDLLAISIPGYHGHCWGYPFDWQNNHGLWKRNTPFITATPYCFEAFVGLFDVTGQQRYLDIAKSIARFVQDDLHDTPTGENAAAGSYSPIDHSQVLNASAYRSMVLFEAASRVDEPRYRATAERNLNFILQNQREDGAWLYALDHPSERFIDHFHTCFVLKNLAKLNRHANSAAVTIAIEKGYAFYRRELFEPDGLPRSFAIRPRRQVVKLDLYNFAEAITLGAVLREQLPMAFIEAQKLANLLIEHYQLPAGYFVSRVFVGGFRHTFPFLRWPQSQLFYALTNLLRCVPET